MKHYLQFISILIIIALQGLASFCFSQVSPDDIADLKLWVKADSAVTYDGSNKVSQWNDCSGLNNHLLQSTPASQPLYVPAAINGLPVIEFDGTDDFVKALPFALNQPEDVFIVYKPITWTSNDGIFDGNTDVSMYLGETGSAPCIKMYGGVYLPCNNDATVGNYHILECLFNSTNSFIRVDNNAAITGDAGTNNAGGFTLGHEEYPGPYYSNIAVAEIIIFNRDLTSNERSQIETYLVDKYAGPAVNLGPDININYGFCDTLLNAGGNYSSYLWSTGDNTPTLIIDHSDTVWVDVADIFGNPSSDTIIVTINHPVISLNDTFFCQGDSVLLDPQITGSYTYLWSNGKTTATIFATQAGPYGVTVSDTNGCSAGSPTINVIEDTYPSLVWLGSDAQYCAGASIGLQSGAIQALSYQWAPGGEVTPTIIVSNPGDYSVTATDASGCAGADTINITINGVAPNVDFSYSSGCSNDSIAFTDLSTASFPETIVNWFWNFGDGYTSTLQNPKHVFLPGTYIVKDSVVSSSGCSNFSSRTIHINNAPVAAFTADTACVGNVYTFADQSIQGDGNIISWQWDFGDMSPGSNDTNPAYTYASPGSYEVTLSISSDSGCTSVFSDSLIVVATAPYPGSIGLNTPPDNSVQADTIINFSWDISAEAVSYTLEYSTSPTFSSNVTSVTGILYNYYLETFSNQDTYYWHVIAYNICGNATSSTNYNFSIFSPTSISGLSLWLMGDSAHYDASMKVDTLYDFSGMYHDAIQGSYASQPQFIADTLNGHAVIEFDGNDDFLKTLPFTLNQPENVFIVYSMLTFANNDGIFDGNTDVSMLLTESSPEPCIKMHAGTFMPSCNNDATTGDYHFVECLFNGTNSYIKVNDSPSVSGDVGSNDAGGFTLGHEEYPGPYYSNIAVAEVLIFNQSLNASERQNIIGYLQNKYIPPPVDLGPDIWSNNFCVDTLDASRLYKNYLWSTGDSVPVIPIFSGINASGDTIWVSVSDPFGNISSDTVIVHKPIVTAYSDTICVGDSTVIFSGLTAPFVTAWVTTNDSIISDSYTIHAGDTVMLHVYDNVGCSVDRQIIMYADSFPLTSLLGAAATTVCSGDTVFPAVDTTGIVSYSWYDGSSYYSTPYYVVPASWVAAQAHNLTLTCTNSRGCEASDIIAVSVPGQSPVPAFSANAGCEPFINQFTDLSTVGGPNNPIINGWEWSFNDGDSAFTQNPTHNFDDPGIHLVTLTVSTNKGCSMSTTDTAMVYSKPHVSFSPLLGCTGVPLQFSDHSTSVLGVPDNWSWNFGDTTTLTDTSSLQSPIYTYDSIGNYTVHLVVTTEYGCTDSIDKQIFVRPAPEVDFSYTNVCDGNAVYFTNETVTDLGIYQMYWDFGNGNIYTTYNPIYTFDAAGTYPVTLHVQSINGCTVNFTDSVVVHAIPTALFNPPDTLCAQAAYTFIDGSTVLLPDTIEQWLWDFQDMGVYGMQNPVLTFTDPGDYPVELTVTSDAGCSSSTTAIVHVNPIPTAAFQPDAYYGMPPFTVNFTDYSTGGFLTYLWDFGDPGSGGNNFSASQNPEHTYTTQDTFMVYLVVTNSSLCTATDSMEIYMVPTTADVAVTNVTTEQQGDFLTVSADIWNFGTRKIYALYLYAKSSGGAIFMETWEDYDNPLEPMAYMPYTFNAQFAVPEEQDLDYICVEAQIQAVNPDDNPANNEECITFNNTFSAFIPYPAPSNDEINIDFILPFKDQVQIDLYGVKGELIQHIFSGEAEKGLNKLAFDISSLNLGVYVYRISFNEDFRILRFVKY